MKKRLLFKLNNVMMAVIVTVTSFFAYLPAPVKALSEYKMVGLGDSIMQGYGVSEKQKFFTLATNYMASKFATQAKVTGTNLGIDGLDTTGLLFHLNRDSQFIDNVKTANLIEINIGGNDGLLPLVDFMMEKLNMTDQINTLIEDELAKRGETWDQYYDRKVAEFNKLYPGGLTQEEIDLLIEEDITKMDIDFFSLLGDSTTKILTLPYSEINSEMKAAANNFSKTGGQWEKIIQRIKTLNPKADIIAITTFNPYKGLKFFMNVIGSEMIPTVDITTNAVNSKIISYATTGNYKVSDISATFSSLKGLYLTGIINSDPHPNAAGHATYYGEQVAILKTLQLPSSGTTPPTKSTVNTLNTLTVDGTEVTNFSPSITGYNLNVDNTKASVVIGATLTDSKSSFVTGYEPKTVTLNVGLNTITLKVSAESGDVNTYTINITRSALVLDPTKPAKPIGITSNKLKILSVIGGYRLYQSQNTKLGFDKNVTDYSVNVPNYVTKVNFRAITEDSEASVAIVGGDNLQVGNNLATITVTPKYGTPKNYMVNIIRKAGIQVNSSTSVDQQIAIAKIDQNESIAVVTEDTPVVTENPITTRTIDRNVVNNAILKNVDLEMVVKKEEKIQYVWTMKAQKNQGVTTPTDINYDIKLNEQSDVEKAKDAAGTSQVVTFKMPANDSDTTNQVRLYVGDKFKDGEKVYLNYYNKNDGNFTPTLSSYEVKGQYVEVEAENGTLYVLSGNNVALEPYSDILYWTIITLVVLIPSTITVLTAIKLKKLKQN